MFLKTKQLTLLAIMAAVSCICLYLGNMIESNTLFFTLLAAFLAGCITREQGARAGVLFFFVCITIASLLLPNKWYCFTYGAFALYVVVREIMQEKVKSKVANWVVRYSLFNVIFILTIIFMPSLIIGRPLNLIGKCAILIFGQLALLFLDRIYEYFVRVVWGSIKKRMG